MFIGFGQSYNLYLLGIGLNTVLDTMWTKYSNQVWKNSHFEGFNLSPALEIFQNTNLSLWMCSSGSFEKIIMSSK